MKSMTGFGRASAVVSKFSVTAELKAVNNRFLDVSLRLSGDVSALDTRVKRVIADRLSRGRVEVNIQYERGEDIDFEINAPLIGGFLQAMRRMKHEFDLAGEPDVNVIARLPNVIQPKKSELSDELISAVESAVSEAVDALEVMRGREGELLAANLADLIDVIESKLPTISAEAANVADEYAARLTRRLAEMAAKSDAQIEIDEGRLAQEVAYLADRADISEEIVRLKTHIEHFRAIMNEASDVGKRLDFLTQELNREANTIASKTNNMIVKEQALAIKSDIEKIREQVQNVE